MAMFVDEDATEELLGNNVAVSAVWCGVRVYQYLECRLFDLIYINSLQNIRLAAFPPRSVFSHSSK